MNKEIDVINQCNKLNDEIITLIIDLRVKTKEFKEKVNEFCDLIEQGDKK